MVLVACLQCHGWPESTTDWVIEGAVKRGLTKRRLPLDPSFDNPPGDPFRRHFDRGSWTIPPSATETSMVGSPHETIWNFGECSLNPDEGAPFSCRRWRSLAGVGPSLARLAARRWGSGPRSSIELPTGGTAKRAFRRGVVKRGASFVNLLLTTLLTTPSALERWLHRHTVDGTYSSHSP